MKALFAAFLLFLAGCASTQRVEPTDPELRASILTTLQADPDIDLRYVTVDVNNRVVTLSGLAGSYEQREKIYRLTRDMRGVEHVVLNLVVQD